MNDDAKHNDPNANDPVSLRMRHAAYTAMLERQYGVIVRVARKLSDPEDQQDLKQVLAFELWKSHADFRGEYRFVGETAVGAPVWGFRDSGIQYHCQPPSEGQKYWWRFVDVDLLNTCWMVPSKNKRKSESWRNAHTKGKIKRLFTAN
jgi:hypothetical protein